MKIKSLFLFFFVLIWTGISKGAFPKGCIGGAEVWLKKSAVAGLPKKRKFCIDSKTKRLAWYDIEKKDSFIASLKFNNINSKEIALVQFFYETQVRIPLINRERKRSTLILYCTGDCFPRAKNLLDTLGSVLRKE